MSPRCPIPPHPHDVPIPPNPHDVPLSPDSELQIALIALFSELLYRFPNLVVAQVTRDSVQAAIANGITADQVGTLGGTWGQWGVQRSHRGGSGAGGALWGKPWGVGVPYGVLGCPIGCWGALWGKSWGLGCPMESWGAL